jgi:hypothetical protein
MLTRRLLRRDYNSQFKKFFSTTDYDLTIIGGGPGGILQN